MFPNANSFYLTGLFKVLFELWLIYYMYPFDVIVMKNGAKVAHCTSACKCCSKTLHLSAGSDKNHAGDSTWWSTKLDDFHFTER